MLTRDERVSSSMHPDNELTASSQPPRWKRRLRNFQNSLRDSFSSKTRSAAKELNKGSVVYERMDGDGKTKEKKRKNSTTRQSCSFRDSKENKSLFWRERGGPKNKHIGLSKPTKNHDNKPLSTTKLLSSMHGKTLSDSRNLNERKHEWRRYYSNNNVSELEKSISQDESYRDVSSEVIRKHSSSEISANNQRRRLKENRAAPLSRPKSVNILTSLFKRSRGSRTKEKTKRGNFCEEQSASEATESQFVRKCDPEISSSNESLDDCDFNRSDSCNTKRYYSLKRSRASLIFPRTEGVCAPKTREKSRTYCGTQLTLENSSHLSESSDFDSNYGLERRQVSRATRQRKRAISAVLPAPSTLDFVHYRFEGSHRLLESALGTDSSHVRYQGLAIRNIRCIAGRMSMSHHRLSNIPSLGVTYVNSDGLESTIVILSSKASQSCFELFKEKERIRLPLSIDYHPRAVEQDRAMGNNHSNSNSLERSASFGDILGQRGTLKSTSSTPDLLSGLSGEKDKKKRMSSMIKGLSLKRHTLAINPKNQDNSKKGKKNRKLFGLGLPNRNKEHKEWKEYSDFSSVKCNSFSRSVDCLADLKVIGKVSPTRRISDGMFNSVVGPKSVMSNGGKMKTHQENRELKSFNWDSDSDDKSQNSSDSNQDFTSKPKNIPYRRGSHQAPLVSRSYTDTQNTEDFKYPEYLDALRKNSRGGEGDTKYLSPQHLAYITKMSTLERERSKSEVTYPNDPQIPPPVRSRILSLEELSPVTAEVILRKKKSITDRKVRAKHSLSVPNGDLMNVEFGSDVKRYSYGAEVNDFNDSPVPLLAYRSFSAELLVVSQESLDSSSQCPSELGSSTSLHSDRLSLPMYPSPLRASMEDISKSPTIHEECEKTESELSMSLQEPNRASLSRNPRLGRSTGDLSFEPTGGLVRTSKFGKTESLFEDMDVPEAFAEALWDHVTMDPEELSFKASDIITVISMTNIDWWFGQVGELVGWFPAPFVRVRVSQTLGELENHLAPPVRTRRFTNEGLLTKDVVRTRVVNEILQTEKSYVKNLKDVIEGYVQQARKRDDMFSEEQLYLLFSNIEEVYAFHQKLLAQMKKCFVKDDPCASQIGAVFLENCNKQGFNIYSEYCNNHPSAISEFKLLVESNKYKHFFEACRLLQDMINISLDGFLLTPVQKICKYPLQLSELLKHTHPTHPDYEPVRQALESMKNVAALINERKRKVENISKIAKWQSNIEGWEGDNVLERSSELICSGDVYKASNGTTQERVCFLFDHQLIYCKKDILRKNGLTYKGRIDMDLAQVQWLDDGEEMHKNEPLNNAWKIFNDADSKWYVVYTKKPADKEKWEKAFATERQKSNQEVESGLSVSQSTRRAVMRSASSSLKGRKAADKRSKYLRSSSQTDFLKSPPSPSLRLPPPVSSEDFAKDAEDGKDRFLGFIQRNSALRRSFNGLRGSKRSLKDKRTSSIF